MAKTLNQLQNRLDILEAAAAPLSESEAGLALLKKAISELARGDEVAEADRPWVIGRLHSLCQRYGLAWPDLNGPEQASASMRH
jgi:hypothetical protein